MSIIAATIVGGGALLGGVAQGAFGAKGAADAAGAQRDASAQGARLQREAMEEQRKMFDKMQEVLAPYVGAGNTALAQIGALLGQPGLVQTGTRTVTDQSARFGNFFNKGQFGAAERTLGERVDAMQRKLDGVQGGQTFADIDRMGDSQLRKEIGEHTVKLAEMRATGSRLETPTKQVPVFEQMSGAQRQREALRGIVDSPMFRESVRQGEEAILQNASATGGLRGGNTQAALAQFRPQILNQLVQQQLDRLMSVSGLGQASAAGVGAGALNLGGQIASNAGVQAGLLRDAGNASAQQALTTSSLIGQGFQQAGQLPMQLGTLNALTANQGGLGGMFGFGGGGAGGVGNLSGSIGGLNARLAGSAPNLGPLGGVGMGMLGTGGTPGKMFG